MQLRNTKTTQKTIKIARSQSRLRAIGTERLNFRLWCTEIFLQLESLPAVLCHLSEPGFATRITFPHSARHYGTRLPADMARIKKIRQITRKRKNRNLAIPAAAAAMPVNPKIAATSAIIKKIRAQRSIFHLLRKQIASIDCCARFFNLTNPKMLRDTFSLRRNQTKDMMTS